MKFMITWNVPPSSYKATVEAFLNSGGAPVPEGMTTLGRWHAPGSRRGWHLAEGDPVAVAEHVAQWAQFCELEITPVIDDEEAAKGLSAAHGQ